MVTSLAQKDQILSLLQDPYANYVVQRALQVSKLLFSILFFSRLPSSPPPFFLLSPVAILRPPSTPLTLTHSTYCCRQDRVLAGVPACPEDFKKLCSTELQSCTHFIKIGIIYI